MKKRFVKLIAMLLSAILLASCGISSSASIPADTSVEKMLGFDRNSTSYKSELAEESLLSYSSVVDADGETILETPIVAKVKLPADWLSIDDNIFQTFNEENNSTILCMKAPLLYKADADFALDENTHAALNTRGIRADLSGWKNCAYKTASGYESIIYYCYDENNSIFSVYTYIKLNNEYVLGLNISDSLENRGQTIDILDSVTLGEYDPFVSYTTTSLESYMSYLVNYFHEPYKKGDDISDVNVMYLCLFYAYCNRDSFFDVKEDIERSTVNIPEERFDEISTSLLGDHVLLLNNIGDITEFEETYLRNGPAGHLYGGVDGFGIAVAYATDHWGGDQYYIDHNTPLEITENGTTVTVKASVYYSPDLGLQENYRDLEYTFEKIAVKDKLNEGHIYYQLIEIKEA